MCKNWYPHATGANSSVVLSNCFLFLDTVIGTRRILLDCTKA